MADRKITDLTALAAGSQATGDLLTIVDVSEGAAADKNKKITVESLFKGIPGNVGIGTASPGRQLTLSHGSQAEIGLLSGADTSGALIYQNASEQKLLLANRESDGHIAFQTGGANERMRIDSSGNVGIGTSSPSETLTLNTSTGASIGFEYNGTEIATINNNNAALYVHAGSSKLLSLGAGGTERMRIDSSGRLLVGTTTANGSMTVNMGTDKNISFSGGVSEVGSVPALQATNTSGSSLASMGFRATDLRFATGSAERMRIDSSGNVGIGVSSPVRPLHVDGTAFISGTAPQLRLNGGASDSSDDDRAMFGLATASGHFFGGSASGDAVLRTTNGGNLLFGEGTTERVRIDSSGNLGLGTSSPSAKLDVAGNQLFSAANPQIQFNAGGPIIRLPSANTLAFLTDSTNERMRIQSDGTVGIGVSNPSCKLDVKVATSSSTSAVLRIRSNWQATSQIQMQVLSDGDVENRNNSYGSISDAKLKENIVDANSQWEDIKNLRVRNYNFIVDEDVPVTTHIGVVAQETELVSPGLVKASPDVDADGNDLGTVTKSVRYSVLYMKAVKALQEAQTRIETLETQQADLLARVTALEAG